jgi:nucleotide-binding universal stress UspA family protein
MYKHILIATDGSAVAQKAVDHGLALAKALNAKVTAISTTEMWAALDVAGADGMVKIDRYEAAAADAAGEVLARFSKAASAAGVPCETHHMPDTTPADGIVRLADELKCDLIVMGSHGRRGLERLLVGSQAYGVVTHAKVPVLVCR